MAAKTLALSLSCLLFTKTRTTTTPAGTARAMIRLRKRRRGIFSWGEALTSRHAWSCMDILKQIRLQILLRDCSP